MKKLLFLIGLLFGGALIASAASVLFPYQGGTGWGNIQAHTVILGNGTGQFATTSPNTAGFVLTSNGVGSDPTFQVAGGAAAFPFTTTTNYGVTVNATSTPIWFQNGMMASTTSYFSTSLFNNATSTLFTATTAWIPTLANLTSNGFVKTSGGTGALSIDTSTYLTGNQTITLSGDVSGSGATAITTTIGALKVLNSMIANSTIDLTAKVTGILPVANGGTATSTQVTNGVNYYDGTKITSGTALTFDGVTITSSGASHTNATSTGTLTIPNSATLTTPVSGNIGIDTTSGQLRAHDGTEVEVYGNGFQTASFTYATSSAWSATTTLPLGTARFAETWADAQCFTDIGTLNVDFYHTTTHLTMFNASTTVGTVTFSSNNTLTSGEKRYVDIGTPATAPTKISCTISKRLTVD